MAFWISKLRQKRSKQILERPTGQPREDRIKISARGVLLTILMWLSVVYILSFGGPLKYSNLAPGQKAPETIVAAVDFSCIDVATTELERRKAADSVNPVFTVVDGPLAATHRTFDKLADRLVQLRATDEGTSGSRLRKEMQATLELVEWPLSGSDMIALLPEDKELDVAKTLKSISEEAWAQGIADPVMVSQVGTSGRITIKSSEGEVNTFDVERVANQEDAVGAAIRALESVYGRRELHWDVVEKLMHEWLQPNLLYDADATSQLRERAQQTVEPIRLNVSRGETLVQRGDAVTQQLVEMVQAHARSLSDLETNYDRLFRLIGQSSLLLAALVICGGLLQIMAPRVLERDAHLFLLYVLSLLTLLPAKGILLAATTTRFLPPDLAPLVVPLGLAPLLATILLGSGAAVAIGIWTSIASAVIFGNNFAILIIGTINTVVAVHMAHDVRRRGTVWRTGLWMGLATALCSISLAALYQHAADTIIMQIVAGMVSGLLAAFLTLLLVQLFEVLFGITTNLTLLELSDMGHPLLQRLALEAPGTYHHSLMVANLAQAATTEIGGNALLVRVCGYFHDIGKLTKPEFFTENTQYRDNPHDDISPSMSTLVIISHVKEGVSLARRHKLPQAIIDGIEQHHGTGLISYFYHRAKKQHEEDIQKGEKTNGRTINEEDFRYPGPKPQTREMGILLLADAIEATSRSMEKPTPNRIENLVHEIVDTRIQDGQLDLCSLTLSELNTIKRTFIFTLTNMMHGRVPYPKDNEDRDQQPAAKSATGPKEDRKTHAVAHGAGKQPDA